MDSYLTGGDYFVSPSSVELRELDLEDLASVRDFAATVESVDLLVLNAGVMAVPDLERTVDGFEKQMGVNHFGHAYLTRLLSPKLTSDDPRVVVVASTAHTFGSLDTNDLNYDYQSYTPWGAYGASKLANIVYAKGLAERLPEATVVSLHPGVIKTPLWRYTPGSQGVGGWLLDRLATDKTVLQGASTSVYACLAPTASLPTGSYLSDCGVKLPNSTARDAELIGNFWEATEAILDAAVEKRGLGNDDDMSKAEAGAGMLESEASESAEVPVVDAVVVDAVADAVMDLVVDPADADAGAVDPVANSAVAVADDIDAGPEDEPGTE